MADIEYVSKLYKDHPSAEKALERLHAIGYGQGQISLIADEEHLPVDRSFEGDTSTLAGRGTMGATGIVLGAGAGALIGAIVAGGAAVAITALTAGAAAPIIVGPLAAVLAGADAGAMSGGIIGGLLELGAEAEDWRVGLRNGGMVIVVSLKSHDDRKPVRVALTKS